MRTCWRPGLTDLDCPRLRQYARPPPEVIRDSLADYRRQLDHMDGSTWQILRLDDYQLNAEHLDITAIVERTTS